MTNLQKKVFVTAMLLSSIGLSSAANAAGATGANADFGVAVAANSYDRVINLKSDTKWINVVDGETIRFNFGDKAFSWHFSTFNEQSFDLSAIAPRDIDVKGVRVFVSRDPMLSGP